jgi:transcriptional regulator with XRE-family HTH domain
MVTHAKTTPLAILGIKAGFTTQEARAAALGISRNHLMTLERGQESPSQRLIQKMLEVYGVTVPALVDAIVESRVEYFRRRLLEKYGRLSG